MPEPGATHVEQLLRQAGMRVTSVRSIVLRLIDENPHLDAASLHRLAQQEDPRIGLASVYRTLNLLSEQGVVRSSALGDDHRHYEVKTTDHIHLICSGCGEITDLGVPHGLHERVSEAGFEIHRARLEITGLCRACREKERR
jgi:Fe2+ or Zn2+ uptake regulation protein